MDDSLSALPPESATWKRAARNPRYSYTNPSPSTIRADSPSQQALSSPNTAAAQSDVPIILAPTPRRHLLESSASQHWLHTPPPLSPSPFSSRPVSPLVQQAFPKASSSSTALPSSPGGLRRRLSTQSQTQTRSFSVLLEHEQLLQQQQEQRRRLAGASSSSSLRGEYAASGSGFRDTVKPNATETEETAMGRRWIRWLHKRGIKQWVVPSILGVSTLWKLSIGLGSYSGRATPPMYGDYEAQRHWMEITRHLPPKTWYTYDLPYWGLDYPPLTAYVSWLCGVCADWINPSWVALDTSRGIESPESKVFMRMSVLALDALVYVPALVMFAQTWQGSRSKRTQELSLLTLIMQPALLLIDFGHFQYNSVMLGFTLLSMNFLATGLDVLGAFFFVLSLGFKQMALYYAPAIGSYLLAKCIYLGPTEGGHLFVRLAVVTVATFLLLFLPWLPPFASLTAIAQPISRIFPFARGLFEDKVANFWCASNVVFKWKAWASRGALVKLSTLLTAVGFLPAVIGLIRAGVKMSIISRIDSDNPKLTHTEPEKSRRRDTEPTPFLPLLPYALLTSSMSFFLFSFQVHEKTILLPLMPITLLLSGASVDSDVYNWGVLVNNVAVFSMWPLLKRDGLGAQYLATLLLWNRLVGHNPIRPPKSFIHLLSTTVYTAAVSLHLLELVMNPPARYPDLFPVLNVLISTPVFVLAWLWSIKCGVEVGWALGGLGKSSRTPVERKSSAQDPAPGLPAGANGTSTGYRQLGGRAVSLGYAQAKRRFEAQNQIGR